MKTRKNIDPRVDSFISETADTICHLRKHKKLRQIDLAEHVKLSHRHIQKIESGEVDLNISTLSKFADAFQIPIHSLIGGADKRLLFSMGIYSVESIMDDLPIGVQILALDGQIAYLNRKMRALLGLETSSGTHHLWDFLSDHGLVDEVKEYFSQCQSPQEAMLSFYLGCTKKTESGEILRVDWKYVVGIKGEPVGYLAMVNPQKKEMMT